MPSKPRFYDLYERPDGSPTPHWQYCNVPRVKGCRRDAYKWYPPDEPTWYVRATSVIQACAFVHDSVTSAGRDDQLGIWRFGEDVEQ